MPPTLLFDLDGCLVDSVAPITTCINLGLAAVGVPPRPVDELRRFIGPPLQHTFVHLLGDRGADAALVARCVDAYRTAYTEEAVRSTAVIEGIPQAMATLAAAGACLSVVTSKPWPFAEPILEAVGLRSWFVAVHGPDADERVEAKATTLARALADLAINDPATAVMIGDRYHDIDAGRACGTRTLGVTWGIGDRQELERAGADSLVDHPHQLASVLLDRRAAGPSTRRAPSGS